MPAHGAGMRGHYQLMDLDALPGRTLESLLHAVRTAGFAGVNITYPCKEAVLPLLDEVSPEARQIGAVNTVTVDRPGRTSRAQYRPHRLPARLRGDARQQRGPRQDASSWSAQVVPDAQSPSRCSTWGSARCSSMTPKPERARRLGRYPGRGIRREPQPRCRDYGVGDGDLRQASSTRPRSACSVCPASPSRST